MAVTNKKIAKLKMVKPISRGSGNSLIVLKLSLFKKPNEQVSYLKKYLSLAPVLAVVSVSVAFSTWAVFNYFFPDLLFHPMP
jgi:photosystem I subunit 9